MSSALRLDHLAAAPDSELTRLVTLQLAVAHAGETSPDHPRLAWWDSDVSGEYAGVDLFQRLYPKTWRWAVLRTLRAIARACDQKARARAAEPDRVVSLFHLGPALDERLDEHLDALQAAHPEDPFAALPALASVVTFADEPLRRPALEALLGAATPHELTSIGRQIDATPDLAALTTSLAGAFVPLAAGAYPLPHVLA